MNMSWEVLSPLGKRAVERVELAQRVDTLEGKTVCEVWNGVFLGERTFSIIEEMLRERYPKAKVISYNEFPLCTHEMMKPSTKEERLEAIRSALVEKGCDVLITGNGF